MLGALKRVHRARRIIEPLACLAAIRVVGDAIDGLRAVRVVRLSARLSLRFCENATQISAIILRLTLARMRKIAFCLVSGPTTFRLTVCLCVRKQRDQTAAHYE